MLPWFQDDKFPLYLAPMARFTDIVFRDFCKQQGADVMVTEFVQADALNREDRNSGKPSTSPKNNARWACRSSDQSRQYGPSRQTPGRSYATRLYRHQLRLPRRSSHLHGRGFLHATQPRQTRQSHPVPSSAPFPIPPSPPRFAPAGTTTPSLPKKSATSSKRRRPRPRHPRTHQSARLQRRCQLAHHR